jgi:hypothetical protein
MEMRMRCARNLQYVYITPIWNCMQLGDHTVTKKRNVGEYKTTVPIPLSRLTTKPVLELTMAAMMLIKRNLINDSMLIPVVMAVQNDA